MSFQSTHPLRGATHVVAIVQRVPHNFNPRTPCGVRRNHSFCWFYPDAISIHAPLAGCDYRPCAGWRRTAPISIHAPLAGCDVLSAARPFAWPRFQSTHPLRGATRRHPGAVRRHPISIHAPLAGCYDSTRRERSEPGHFNPRTPQGVRLSHGTKYITGEDFNPRTPQGVRRFSMRLMSLSRKISIHAPLAGCDASDLDTCECRIIFQSTHPLRGATSCRELPERPSAISIHAPLAGCDLRYSGNATAIAVFQSTHPLRGATVGRVLLDGYKYISIHAPLAGCDVRRFHKQRRQDRFQSTHPLRGATRSSTVSARSS